MILVVFIGGSLALFAWRAPLLKQGGLFAPISRESALVFNNLFLATACATVFVGTLYPLVLEMLTGDKISVGAPFFNLTFGPLFVPLLVAVPFGPLLAWKRGDLYGVAQRLLGGMRGGDDRPCRDLRVQRHPGRARAVRHRPCAVRDGRRPHRLRRAHRPAQPVARDDRDGARAGLPRSAWGTAVAHFALGITLLGIVSASTWGSERIVAMKPAQTVSHQRLRFELSTAWCSRAGANYRETRRDTSRCARAAR